MAALMDLGDPQHNTRDGLHIASLAGAWIAAVAGLGGLRPDDGTLRFARAGQATYRLLDGERLDLHHHGAPATVEQGSDLRLAIPSITPGPAPRQPPYRAPERRGRGKRPRPAGAQPWPSNRSARTQPVGPGLPGTVVSPARSPLARPPHPAGDQ